MVVGRMQVVYQSPEEVILQPDGGAVPLYCVASGHTLEFKYKWQMNDQHIGCSSPVAWVNQPGLYRCRVEHHIMQEECSTKLICVITGEKGTYYVM